MNMTYGGQVGRGARPRSAQTNVTGRAPLTSSLEDLGLSADSPPDGATWRWLLAQLETCVEQARELEARVTDLERDSSSFENLFRTSPVPMMEQDYTEIQLWMDDLRSRGVTDIREVLTSIDDVKRVVSKIKIIAANPAAVEAVGLSLDQLIGPIDPVIVNEGSEAGWLSQLTAVWEREPVASSYFVAATADGDRYDAQSILSAPKVDGEPDFSRVVFSLIDITSHRDEERRMAKLVEQKNRFLASVSHELRTPLTAILGFSRILEDDTTLTVDDHRLMITSVSEHAQEMSHLIEDLLVAARSDLNRLDILDEKVDLLSEIDQLVTAGGSFTTDVEVRCETSEPYAMGDPSRLRQILRNLLTNAERYGGDEVSVTVSSDRSGVLVDVVDNGEGLPAEEWERIFEPYESAHITVGRPGSVGIGLAISRQLAGLMGGTLDYTYEADQSLFRLRLRPAGD